jgi:hypothetical protein
LEHIETVLEHLVPYEKKEDINGTEYLLKIAPLELSIDGILVFVNLTHAKHT